MNDTDPSLNEHAPTAPRILLTVTNRWPVVPRLVLSLSKVGCRVAVLCPIPGHPVQKVNAGGPVFYYNGFTPIRSLRTAIESFSPDIVVPCCDRSVQQLHELHTISRASGGAGPKIAGLIERSIGSPESFPIVSSRCELLKIAQSEGILVPRTVAIERDLDPQLWNAESARPWVIKADGTWGGSGVRIAQDAAEAKHLFLKFAQRDGIIELAKKMLLNRDRSWILFDWKHSRRSVIAQALIDGRPANCAIVCWQGKVLAGVAVEVVKSRGMTGPATVVKVVPGLQMIAAAEAIARRLRISGFLGLDFMIEKHTGAVYLIEMNPRCTPPCPLPLGNGQNLVAALWTQLTGQQPLINEAVIRRDIIAYFPQPSEDESLNILQSNNGIHHDLPQGEPELVYDLLHPWSRRSIVGQLIDRVQLKRPQKNTSITFATNKADTTVREKPPLETQA